MTLSLIDLWLPIVLSAMFVFVASSIIHMVLPIHRGDFRKLPDERRILETLRSAGIQPGSYMFPFPESMKEMGSPEMIEKYKKGPVGSLVVKPSGPPTLGVSLVQWFLYSVLISVFTAYLAMLGLQPGAAFPAVFRVAGTAAILGYALADIPNTIWKGQRWTVTLRFVFDGVVYGLLTGATFGWLWPGSD